MKSDINTKLIMNFIKASNFSKTVFCKKCKISPSTLNKILDGNDNLSILPICKIARVMKVKIHELFM